MLFGLKYVRATYQCLINKTFEEQIGRIVKVYVDDMIVKRKTFEQNLIDLKEVFVV